MGGMRKREEEKVLLSFSPNEPRDENKRRKRD